MFVPLTVGKNTIILDRGYNTTCTVNLFGCAITSWRVNNLEQLYIRRSLILDENSPVLEGINTIFPKYGRWLFGPDNGFLRLCQWQVENLPRTLKNGNVIASFVLKSDPFTISMWSYAFEMKYEIVLCERELQINVTVLNMDKEPISFNYLLEVNLKSSNVKNVILNGLTNCLLYNINNNTQEELSDPDRILKIDGATYHIYHDNPNEFYIDNKICNKRITFKMDNCNDVKIWNGWKNKVKEEGLYDSDEYLHMLCVGVGSNVNEIKLMPEETYQLKVRILAETIDEALFRIAMEGQDWVDFSFRDTGHDAVPTFVTD